MLRLIVLLLLLANGLYFAWSHRYLQMYGFAPQTSSEPQRVQQQIKPDAVQLLTAAELKKVEAQMLADAGPKEARHPQHDGEQMEGQVMRTGDALSDAHGVLRFGSVLEADHESLDRIGRDLAIALGCQRDCRSAAVQE